MKKENIWLKRIGYGAGDFGCNFVFATMASYLMYFYTDVFGISAIAVGTMLFSTRFIDAITDTLMGLIVDRTKTRWGSGRPYFVIGAPFFALFTTLTFYVPSFGPTGKIIYAYVTYIMLCTAYTVVNIPLNTIVPRLTSDFHERNMLVASRMICALLGTAVVMGITQPLVEFLGNGSYKRGYFITMTIYGLIAMFIFFFTFSQTEEVVPPSVKREKTSVIEDFKGLNGQSWLFFVVNILYFGLFVVRNSSVVYYFNYNLDHKDWLTFVGFFGILSGLPILIFLPRLQKTYTQKHLSFFCCGLYIVGALLALLSHNFIIQLISLALTGLGMYGIFGVTFSMQPDIIDYSEYNNNRSIPGMLEAMQGFFVKFGMGVAAFIVGAVMSNAGYEPNVKQTAQSLNAIEFCYIWLPIIICVLIVLIMNFYKLDAIRADMTEVLAKRRKQIELLESQK